MLLSELCAYSIAMLSSLAKAQRAVFDSDRIWNAQSLDSRFEKKLARLARIAETELSGGGSGTSNVTEWAKRPECWDRMQGRLDDAAKIFG